MFTVTQAVAIDPFNIRNLYINYTLKSLSEFSQTRIKLTFNNLFDKHSIVGVNRQQRPVVSRREATS